MTDQERLAISLRGLITALARHLPVGCHNAWHACQVAANAVVDGDEDLPAILDATAEAVRKADVDHETV